MAYFLGSGPSPDYLTVTIDRKHFTDGVDASYAPFLSQAAFEEAKANAANSNSANSDAAQKEQSILFQWDRDIYFANQRGNIEYISPSCDASSCDNVLKTREEFEKHFLSQKAWQIHQQLGHLDRESLKHYLDAKYEHYLNGQSIDSIDVTKLGFEMHKFGTTLNQYGAEYPNTVKLFKTIGKGADYIFEKVGDVLSVAGKATFETSSELGKHLNEEVSFNAEHGIISKDHVAKVVEPIIKPLHEAIAEYVNDLTAEQLTVFKATDEAGKTLFVSGIVKEIGKNYLFSSIAKTLTDGTRKNLDTAIEKSVIKLDGNYKKIPLNQRPINIDKAVFKIDVSLKATATALLEEENALLAEIRAGKYARSDFQNHHMVSETYDLTKEHPIWSKINIDINDPINKILLPTAEGIHPTRSKHLGAHTQKNRDRIMEALDDIQKRGDFGQWSTEEYNKAMYEWLLEERKGLMDGTIDLYDK